MYLGRLCLLKALYFVILLTFTCLPKLTCHLSFFFYCFILSLSHPVDLFLVQNLMEWYRLLVTCILEDPSRKLWVGELFFFFSLPEWRNLFYRAIEWANSGTSLWKTTHLVQLSTVSELIRIRIMTGKVCKLRHWTVLCWEQIFCSKIHCAIILKKSFKSWIRGICFMHCLSSQHSVAFINLPLHNILVFTAERMIIFISFTCVNFFCL